MRTRSSPGSRHRVRDLGPILGLSMGDAQLQQDDRDGRRQLAVEPSASAARCPARDRRPEQEVEAGGGGGTGHRGGAGAVERAALTSVTMRCAHARPRPWLLSLSAWWARPWKEVGTQLGNTPSFLRRCGMSLCE